MWIVEELPLLKRYKSSHSEWIGEAFMDRDLVAVVKKLNEVHHIIASVRFYTEQQHFINKPFYLLHFFNILKRTYFRYQKRNHDKLVSLATT